MEREFRATSRPGTALIGCTNQSKHMLESSTWYSRMPAFTNGVVRYCGRETASIAELRECRIRVNAISPGNINAPIFEGWQQGDGLTKMKEELAKNVPLGRLGDPDGIAKAVAFLA